MKPLSSTAVIVLSSCLLGSCAVGPNFHAPAVPETQTYTHGAQPMSTVASGGAAGIAQSFETVDHAPRTWWKQFGSDALNHLVDDALAHSPTLAQARARLTEARENYNAQVGTTLFPTVDAKLSGTRQKIDLAAIGVANVPNPGPFTLYNASVNVSYVLDVFGGHRRALEATMAQVDYQAFELAAARLTLAGNVVSTVIRRASVQRQIELTGQIEQAQAQQLAIIERRYAAGGVSELDVRTQRTLLAQSRAMLPPLATQLALADHQLAILTGVPPSNAQFGDITLDALHLPDRVPLTLPSTLARERPDVQASEALLHQASANVGVATANLYPQFAISAGVGSERRQMEDLLNGLNIWNIGLNLTQPIFHGGELHAKKRAAVAAYNAALADYRQTVLQALQQVADTLRALENDARELQARDEAARQAKASLTIARAQYAAGGVSQFALIDAQRQTLQAVLDRIKAQADRFADTAALFQALGGTPLATAEQQ